MFLHLTRTAFLSQIHLCHYYLRHNCPWTIKHNKWHARSSTLQATPTVTTSPPQKLHCTQHRVVIPLEDPTITSTLQVLNLTLQDLNFPFFSYSNKTISNPFFHPTLRYALTFRTSNSSIGLATEVAVDLAIRGNATGTNDSGMTVGIVGDIDSERVGPAALASGVFKIVQCTPATDPSFSDKADFTHLFRITPSDEAQGHALASLVSYFGWTKVALISANTFYGFGVSSGFQSRALTLNITTLRNEAYNRGDTEFRLQMASLKTSDARIFVVVGDGEDAILMLREARRLGMTGREYLWIGSDRVEGMHKRLYDPNTLFPYTSEDRENAEGMIFLSRMLRDSPGFIDFTIRFRQMYNKTPPFTSYHLRDCLLAMAAGFKRIVETTAVGEIVGRRTGVDAVGFTRGWRLRGRRVG
ncbi:periplasmic binding protein-like I [Chytridium lagenaria]|nr:periplasmic binding protein-like I [Chytridium lagenaria]